MDVSISYLSATIIVLILSAWKCVSNTILLVSYTKQNKKFFKLFSLNIVCLTINAFFQGLFGILAGTVGLIAVTHGVGTYTCSVPIILFLVSITDECWQTLYVFIQQCLAFSSRRVKPNPRHIVLVNLGILTGSLVCLGIPLYVWTRNDSAQQWRACRLDIFVNTSTAFGYFGCLTGLPGLISVVLYIYLHFRVRRDSKTVVSFDNVELSTGKIISTKTDTLRPLGDVRLETNTEPTNLVLTSTSTQLHVAENFHEEHASTSEANVASSVFTISQERRINLTKKNEERLTGDRQENKRKAFTTQKKALKTMAKFLLVNTSLDIQFFFVWLVNYIWPHLPGMNYVSVVSFALLYFNTSLNIFVLVKRYKVIRDSILGMLRAWKAAATCRSCHTHD